ncbi:hypothetical protein C8F01DRAFT_1155123 [Mycena amicta]|nr:hypothetical protein C8F01DRAFT_1155123 [Mycena amicta]
MWCSVRRAAATMNAPVTRRQIQSLTLDSDAGRYSVRAQTLSSLRADTLQSSDFIDVAGGHKLQVRFPGDHPPLRLTYQHSDAVSTPFPPNARGYLYYHAPHPSAPLSGSIRLRIDSDNALGTDLLLPDGLPWQIVLPTLVHSKNGAGALRQLISESLVDSETIASCRAVFSGWSAIRPKCLFFAIDQPFAIPMTVENVFLTVVGKEKLERLRLRSLFGRDPARYPYTGSLLARFELSSDVTRVFIRILKIVDPIVCVKPEFSGRRVVAPLVGDLVSHRTPAGVIEPWSLNLLKDPKASALRLLIGR